MESDLSGDPDMKGKALKNAFELVRQKRYTFACAFFIFAGKWRDALDVCIRYLNDASLALLVARL